jgi:peptidoglycan/LPS O-acetylase OafA/YrhL
MDGLRGVAALFVVFHHYAIVFTVSSQKGFHHDQEIAAEGQEPIPPQEDNWILLFPLIRVIHSGRFMVAIFFVISGYVLSYRGLKLAREGKANKLLDSLGSSVFRRWLRLHLPVIASTFLAFLLTRAGAYTELDEVAWPRAV